LDKSNETVAKYLQEYQQFASDLSLEKKIELISDLVKYQDHYKKVYKFKNQQRKPMSKNQKIKYYMAVIKSYLGWRFKDFKGMSFEDIEAKFTQVCKQIEDFTPMGSKDEAERAKKQGIILEKEQVKKQKLSKEVPESKSPIEEVSEDRIKEMMQLVPVEDVYVQALQVKHPIIDWKVHSEGERTYWQIIRLGGSTACYQPASNDKEMELWVELKKMYEPDPEDQLWTLTQNYMHAPVEWKLYDLSGVHHVTAKDKEIFMLVEKDYPLRRGHQVTPKECHLHAVKRILRYLKGHPKLGLWYPKATPFDLVAFSDSNNGGAS
nr:putative ribonuclease H-like domain-containing protein [Tanacetum cinerariifolium]